MQTESAKTQNWIIREAKGDDVHFLYSYWLNSYGYSSPIVRGVTRFIFYREYNKIVDHILNKPFANVLIACLPDNPSVLIGFIVYEPKLLHYIFVKEAFRDEGIGKSLFQRAFGGEVAFPMTITHLTDDAKSLMKRYEKNFIYNPFLLFVHTITEGESLWQDQLKT